MGRPDDPFEPFEIGRTLGRYVILQRAGSGGMAVVYAAYDPDLDRKVALKVLRPYDDLRADADLVQSEHRKRIRALREAQALAKLSHPNVLPVFDVGTVDGHIFFATEFVEGETLNDWLERPRSWREILSVMRAAGRGLAAAHAQDFVHRDFKPHNVMIGTDGQVRVMDFGLVRQDEGQATWQTIANTGSDRPDSGSNTASDALTHAGTVLGTPQYMAPEQHTGSAVDARADQYSFCVTLYQALYGVRPFEDVPRQDLLAAKMAMQLVNHARRRSVPRWLSHVILRGLQPDPDLRWPSLAALLEALERPPGRRRRQGALVLIGVLGMGGGAWEYARNQEAQAAICSGGLHQLEGVWDESRRDAMRRAFVATGLSYAQDSWNRAENSLNHYATQWLAMHRDACETTEIRHEQSASMLDARMACLQGHLQDLTALTDVFMEADPTVVRNAIMATRELPKVDRCADLTALSSTGVPAPDASIEVQLKALSQQLAAVKAEHIAGRIQKAMAMAERTLTAAQTLAHPPFEARVRARFGAILEDAAQFDGAEHMFEEANWIAEANRMEEQAYLARSHLTFVVGYGLGRFEDGLWWSRHAESALAGLPNKDDIRGHLAFNRGALFSRAGKFADAFDLYRQAAEQFEPDDHQSVTALSNAGAAALEVGRPIEAARLLDEAIDRAGQLLGPSHPKIGQALVNRGTIAFEQNRNRDAKRDYSRALEILGQGDPSVNEFAITALRGLANVLSSEQKFTEAFEQLELARSRLAASVGTQHVEYAALLNQMGEVEGKRGQMAHALALHREALSILEEADSAGTSLPSTLAAIADLLIEFDRSAEALPLLERAQQLVQTRPDRASSKAGVTFVHAKALAKTDLVTARRLANEALEALSNRPSRDAHERAQTIEAWLAQHEDEEH